MRSKTDLRAREIAMRFTARIPESPRLVLPGARRVAVLRQDLSGRGMYRLTIELDNDVCCQLMTAVNGFSGPLRGELLSRTGKNFALSKRHSRKAVVRGLVRCLLMTKIGKECHSAALKTFSSLNRKVHAFSAGAPMPWCFGNCGGSEQATSARSRSSCRFLATRARRCVCPFPLQPHAHAAGARQSGPEARGLSCRRR